MAREPVEIAVDTAKAVFKKVVIGVIVLILFFSSFYQISSGEEGVLLTFSKADPMAKAPGLHFKWPLLQRVIKFDMTTQKYETDASAASHDLQDVHTKVAVNYHLQPGKTPDIFSIIGVYYSDNIIQPSVQEVVKSVTAQYTAEELITKRAEVKEKINTVLKARLSPRNIVVEDLSITNFEFSEAFSHAIESKVTAEQLKLKAERDLERIRVEAEQVVAQAEGDSQQIRLIQDQLAHSPQYIEWLKWSKWDGRLPTVMGGTPLISVPVPTAQE